MEDINEKAEQDELNKGYDDIESRNSYNKTEVIWTCKKCGREFVRKGKETVCNNCNES